ncbi:hypothetical protein JK211_14550 [Tatumella sp. JGM130]|uniref:hypothetical protein n=1 Tax=Tatumella sp. JGM130 TaxID=2799797 RepID=UPI001BB05478|nr:hypothetical protein [Tatumella sp. JGM130]MBS0895235.1 hypothetical protein [Tatumella sp. JGM130]
MSLEHCPKIIKGDFNCSFNELTSLEYCPELIKGFFMCDGTCIEIRSLCYFNSVIEGKIYGLFGSKEKFLNEVAKQKLLKEKESLLSSINNIQTIDIPKRKRL